MLKTHKTLTGACRTEGDYWVGKQYMDACDYIKQVADVRNKDSFINMTDTTEQ